MGYYYTLVNVETEKRGYRYLKIHDGSNFGETRWLCEQVDGRFHLVDTKPQANITQNITINLHNPIEKVYILQTVWKNGRKFEGETNVKPFADKELALSFLNVYADVAKKCLLICYDEEEIEILKHGDTIEINADDYDDCWTGWVVEETIQR